MHWCSLARGQKGYKKCRWNSYRPYALFAVSLARRPHHTSRIANFNWRRKLQKWSMPRALGVSRAPKQNGIAARTVALRSCFTLDRPSWDRRPQSCSNIAYHPQTANQPSLYRALFGSRSRRRGADEGGMTFLPSGPASNSACRKFDHKPRSIRPTQNLSDRNRTKLERFFALVRHPST